MASAGKKSCWSTILNQVLCLLPNSLAHSIGITLRLLGSRPIRLSNKVGKSNFFREEKVHTEKTKEVF